MKRKLCAVLCSLSLFVSLTTSAVALTPDPMAVSADSLHTLGLLDSPASGYDLSTTPTRLTGITLLVRLSGASDAALASAKTAPFGDVPTWAQSSVNYAYSQGWVSGFSATQLGSYNTLSANAYCAMLLRMLGYDDQAGDFSVDSAALFAQRLGVLRHDVVPSGSLTMGDLANISYDILTVTYRDSDETVLDRLLETSTVANYVANAMGLTTTVFDAREISDRYQSAVFALDCFYTEKSYTKNDADANASGFFISADGLAITNYHSLEGHRYAVGTLSTGEQVEVERVLYYDVDIDMAVVQMSKPTDDAQFCYFDMVSRDTVEAGDICFTLSNPLGLGISVSSGVVSATESMANGYELACIVNTATISQGSSGGVLINQYGDAMGITSGAYTYGNNMYLAVPLDTAINADLTVEGWTLSEIVEIEDTGYLSE